MPANHWPPGSQWLAGWCPPPPVAPLGTAGWATGLPEQARGTGQATQFGMAGVSSVPPYPSSEHSVPTGMGSMIGGQAAELAVAVTLDTNPNARSLMKLTPYNGTGSLETFLEKFGCMSQYRSWKEGDMFHHLCASLEGNAGQVL